MTLELLLEMHLLFSFLIFFHKYLNESSGHPVHSQVLFTSANGCCLRRLLAGINLVCWSLLRIAETRIISHIQRWHGSQLCCFQGKRPAKFVSTLAPTRSVACASLKGTSFWFLGHRRWCVYCLRSHLVSVVADIPVLQSNSDLMTKRTWNWASGEYHFYSSCCILFEGAHLSPHGFKVTLFLVCH